ncbi:MAG: hypothetical protein NC039_07995 [Muribaculaceae bacterium]|nr:hypothetical protein [Muribaculaceae bacterium]
MVILIAAEIFLRVKFGFCDAPLLVASDEYEYSFAPSQDRIRLGNRIIYNSSSQRSDEPDSNRVIVLGLGDSVINGGVMTDQSELATTLASDSVIQILNISAGSWGPDNCAAYLRRHGTFGAREMLLVVSSHDAHDIMDFSPVVGVHKSYPEKQYPLALLELIDRYIIPHFRPKTDDPDAKVINGIGKHIDLPFNPGFDELKHISDSLDIPMKIYLHPEISEISEGRFNSQGEEIIRWATLNGIPLSTGFEYGEDETTLRDQIHLNPSGQKALAEWMRDAVNNI